MSDQLRPSNVRIYVSHDGEAGHTLVSVYGEHDMAPQRVVIGDVPLEFEVRRSPVPPSPASSSDYRFPNLGEAALAARDEARRIAEEDA